MHGSARWTRFRVVSCRGGGGSPPCFLCREGRSPRPGNGGVQSRRARRRSRAKRYETHTVAVDSLKGGKHEHGGFDVGPKNSREREPIQTGQSERASLMVNESHRRGTAPRSDHYLQGRPSSVPSRRSFPPRYVRELTIVPSPGTRQYPDPILLDRSHQSSGNPSRMRS
jgi:hypothetical protein